MQLALQILFCIIFALLFIVFLMNKKINKAENDIVHIQKDLVEIRGVIYK